MNYPIIDMKATGNKIKDLRKEKKIKISDIVEYMGFESQQAVYKWQRGESLPSVDNLYALSQLFDTTVDNILVGNKEERDTPSSNDIEKADIFIRIREELTNISFRLWNTLYLV